MENKIICYKCKRKIEPCVCAFFVTHWLEEGEEYECFNCWTNKLNEDYKKEKHCREILAEILIHRSSNGR